VERGALDKWFALEYATLQRALVREPRPIGDLLDEATPSATTRSGEPHRFARPEIERLASGLDALGRRRLKLPIFLYVDGESMESAAVRDETAARALQAAGVAPQALSFRMGALWLSLPLAYELNRALPTTTQFVFL